MMEFLWFAALVFVAYLVLRLGVRLWKKEAEGRRALGKKISEDAKTLVNESEAWLAKEWERRFKGGSA